MLRRQGLRVRHVDGGTCQVSARQGVHQGILVRQVAPAHVEKGRALGQEGELLRREEAPGLGGGGQDADEVLRLPQDGVQLRDGADFIEVRAPGPAAAGDAGDVGRAHAL